jgi:hypothetical protein
VHDKPGKGVQIKVLDLLVDLDNDPENSCLQREIDRKLKSNQKWLNRKAPFLLGAECLEGIL